MNCTLFIQDSGFNSICLFLQEGKTLIYTQEAKHSLDLSSLYDPCFLLPLFSFILRPGNLTRYARNALDLIAHGLRLAKWVKTCFLGVK